MRWLPNRTRQGRCGSQLQRPLRSRTRQGRRGSRRLAAGIERTPGPVGAHTPLPAAGRPCRRWPRGWRRPWSERLGAGQLDLPALPHQPRPRAADSGRSRVLLRRPGGAAETGQPAGQPRASGAPTATARPGRGMAVTPEQAIPRLGLHGLRAAVIELAVRRVIERATTGSRRRCGAPGNTPWRAPSSPNAWLAQRSPGRRVIRHACWRRCCAIWGCRWWRRWCFQLEFELGGHRRVRSFGQRCGSHRAGAPAQGGRPAGRALGPAR